MKGKRIAQNMGNIIGLIKHIYYVIFCAGWWRGEGVYPPFPLIGPKTVFFGQKTPFSAKKIPFSETDRPWRGGYPPFSVNFFPLTFRKILVRGGPGGGVPPQRKVSVPGVFEPSPYHINLPTSKLPHKVPSSFFEGHDI